MDLHPKWPSKCLPVLMKLSGFWGKHPSDLVPWVCLWGTWVSWEDRRGVSSKKFECSLKKSQEASQGRSENERVGQGHFPIRQIIYFCEFRDCESQKVLVARNCRVWQPWREREGLETRGTTVCLFQSWQLSLHFCSLLPWGSLVLLFPYFTTHSFILKDFLHICNTSIWYLM